MENHGHAETITFLRQKQTKKLKTQTLLPFRSQLL